MVCNRAVKWSGEEEAGAVRARREAQARHTSTKTTARWEEYAV